jgi:hypothetical protein
MLHSSSRVSVSSFYRLPLRGVKAAATQPRALSLFARFLNAKRPSGALCFFSSLLAWPGDG